MVMIVAPALKFVSRRMRARPVVHDEQIGRRLDFLEGPVLCLPLAVELADAAVAPLEPGVEIRQGRSVVADRLVVVLRGEVRAAVLGSDDVEEVLWLIAERLADLGDE